MKDDALLPCPFCGGEASKIPDANHSTGWEVGCFSGKCDVEPHVWAVHLETAAMQWNTRALPAVTVGAKPLRYFEPEGSTVEQMRDHARQHPLAQEGDMKLVWINEGDLSIYLLAAMQSATVAAAEWFHGSPIARAVLAELEEK